MIMANGAKRSDDDLVTALLRTYKRAPNEEFVGLIWAIKNEAERENTEIDPEDLMIWASTRYNNLVCQKQWNCPNHRDAKILALES